MTDRFLVVRAGNRLCALTLDQIGETMRPLAIESLPNVPKFVRGASIVRGRVTPVVALAVLLGEAAAADGSTDRDYRRLVTLKTGTERRVGLLVHEVVGIRRRSALSAPGIPPLLGDVAANVVDDLARLDGELLMVLRASALVPDEVWAAVEGSERQ